MSKTKFGVFSVLALSVMMLLIPATSIASAQEYDRYYEDNSEYTNEEYYYPSKDKKKEPPMLLVKKDLLFCDTVSNGIDPDCNSELSDIPESDSDRWVQECNSEQCERVNPSTFDIVVTANIEFPGSEEGTKLNFNGERYTVTETGDSSEIEDMFNQFCQQNGFDKGIADYRDDDPLRFASCVNFEGDCSGIIQDGELKECTVENYVFGIEEEIG